MNLLRSVVSLGTKFLYLFSSPVDSLPLYIPKPRMGLDVVVCSALMKCEFTTPDLVKEWPIESLVWVKENDILGHEWLFVKTKNGFHFKFDRTTLARVVQDMLQDGNPTRALLGEDLMDVPISDNLQQQVRQELQDKVSNLANRERNDLSMAWRDRTQTTIGMDRIYQLSAPERRWYNSNNQQLTKKTPKGGLFALFTLTFPESDTSFTLRDLGIVTASVTLSKPDYKWNGSNCYWFARTMISVIMAITETSQISYEGLEWAGRPIIAGLPHVPEFQLSDVAELADTVKRKIADDDQRIEKICETLRLAESTLKAEARVKEAEARTKEAEARMRETEAKMRQKQEEAEARTKETEAKMRQKKEEAEARMKEIEAKLSAQAQEIELLRLALARSNAHVGTASSSTTYPVPA